MPTGFRGGVNAVKFVQHMIWAWDEKGVYLALDKINNKKSPP